MSQQCLTWHHPQALHARSRCCKHSKDMASLWLPHVSNRATRLITTWWHDQRRAGPPAPQFGITRPQPRG